jgi:membrane-associated phospholipid phosphatase
MTFRAVDVWTLAYLAFVTAVLAARWSLPLPRPELLVLAHVLILATVLLAAALRTRRPNAFLAEFYGVFLLSGVYTEVGILNSVQGLSHDRLVQSWEASLFGGQPSFEWIRAMPWPPMSYVLHAAYLSYYFIVAGTPLVLWLSGRKDGARETILRIMATFYVCYAVFLLFPVAGPRYLFPLVQNAATDIGPARFTQQLLNNAAAWGTAFPSSHVAVSVVTALSAWLAWRAFGAFVVVLAALLTLGTVYGQFHYAIDAIAGTVVGVAMLAVRRRAEKE